MIFAINSNQELIVSLVYSSGFLIQNLPDDAKDIFLIIHLPLVDTMASYSNCKNLEALCVTHIHLLCNLSSRECLD
jgi:hypothetical protein